VTGIELSCLPWLRSVLRQKLLGPKNLDYKRADFWPYDCAHADAVVVFLRGNVIERLGDKLRRELKPGALIIDNAVLFHGDWQPVETHTVGMLKSKVYVYRQP
jgi:hypothetical protein